MDVQELERQVMALLEGLPIELRDAVTKKVEFFKTKMPAFTAEEILREAEDWVKIEMLAYMDRRQYLFMYNRKFAEHSLFQGIVEIVSTEGFSEEDLFRLGRVNFDMNGLKALNDLGGHEAGNKGLEMFANILRNGETTKWLKDSGVKVIISAEGGDEFGMTLKSEKDLRPMTSEIVERYVAEMERLDASSLINFAHPAVTEKIATLGIADEIPADFKFRISTSVGVALLGEALAYVPIEETGGKYEAIVKKIINKLFEMADKRAIAHKSAFKEELGKTNPILSGLYARMSREVIHLEKEINKRDARIRELEEKPGA